MDDPTPENIDGVKVHKFEHSINWGYTALAVAIILAVGFLYFRLENGEGSSDAV